ncbi:hypothetical protein ACKWRH_20920 [Bradyrhizobium sp. Pa8]|uniref:hypothetical protein n=1 Tax=Bradyrhizobium sp. Pa8 TaxID=3386552 RepID=UPI00403F90A8
MRRFRIPEIFLGCFLTVAVFAGGMTFESSRRQPPQSDATSQSASSDQGHAEKGSVWDWIFRDASGFFTAWLVIVGLGQIGMFFWQLRYMRKGMRDSTIAAEAARTSAGATVAQAEIARNSAIQLQRPYIFIFGVTEFKPTQTAFSVYYTVANYGAIPAIVEDAFVGFVFSDRGEPGLPNRIWDDHDLSTSPILEAGAERRSLTESVPDGMDSTSPINIPDGAGGWYPTRFEPDWNVPTENDVFFRVVIRYRGPFSSGHETSATWLCERESKQLIQRGGEDYNYNR